MSEYPHDEFLAVHRPRTPVSHQIGFVRTEGLVRAYPELLAEEFHRHGVDRPPLPAATIGIVPPSMAIRRPGDADAPGPVWPMRYIPDNGSGHFQPWQAKPPAFPRPRSGPRPRRGRLPRRTPRQRPPRSLRLRADSGSLRASSSRSPARLTAGLCTVQVIEPDEDDPVRVS